VWVFERIAIEFPHLAEIYQEKTRKEERNIFVTIPTHLIPRLRFRRSLDNPATPPSLWNLFRENNLSGRSRNRAGGQTKEKPTSNDGDGSSVK
jgi:hypothetical protein